MQDKCFPLFQVAFNPYDNTQLCVIGNGLFKLFRYSEGTLKQFSFQKLDPQNYLCQAWVSDERVIVGTESGRLLLMEAGELKTEFTVTKSDSAKERLKKLHGLQNFQSTQAGGSFVFFLTVFSVFELGIFCILYGTGVS